jgi:hypothetical protein
MCHRPQNQGRLRIGEPPDGAGKIRLLSIPVILFCGL